MNYLNSLDLPKRFALMAAVLIFISGMSAQMFYTRQERTDLEMRLREKSTFINTFYSFLIADALMRNDDITLLQVVNRLEEDQEVTGVTVVDKTDEIRYQADPQRVGTVLDDPLIKNVLQSGDAIVTSFQNSGGRALALVSPLKVQGQALPIGAVRIDMTYRRIENQLSSSKRNFWFVMLGSVVSCAGIVLMCLNLWVTGPLQHLAKTLGTINTAMPEANLPEGTDEVGEVFRAANDLIVRFKAEAQRQWTDQRNRGEQEKLWVSQLAQSFLPEGRVIVADKDNRVLADSGNGNGSTAGRNAHLMDLIKDANFANLLNNAFRQEGQVVRGAVSFEDKTYQAAILSMPVHQTVLVKTLIALQPN